MKCFLTFIAVFVLLPPCTALEPAEIAVVVNRMVPSSVELGEYYCKARSVPKENLVPLMLPRAEEMTREEYGKFLVGPLREALTARKDKIKCVLLMSGVPLRVGPKTPSDEDKAEAARLNGTLEAVKAKATDAAGRAALNKLQTDILQLEQRESNASVDSELMLLWWDNYPLARWVLNPLHWQAPESLRRGKPPVLMTARLDGPSYDIVKRLIDDAISVEAEGLKGTVAIDARGIAFDVNKPSENGGYGYGAYDESMRETAAQFSVAKWTVNLDDNDKKLFEPKSQKDVAIYCGWYSHGTFIDCCTYAKGAVAWHLASSEAVSLRLADRLWCPCLLKAGVAVTLGPVAEPYTIGFPKPAEFFGFLGTGLCLAETHAKTVTFASWMMTCVGDPLYTPFRKSPLWKSSEILPSPKAGRSLFR